MTWDLLVVGAGPAGASAALGALRAEPSLRVALLDQSDFPRDKACGDGIAPHVLDLLEEAGVAGIVDDQVPVPRLRLSRGPLGVDREMARPSWVVPRAVFDERLVDAARAAGATVIRHRARQVRVRGAVGADGHTARVVVGADGAHSVVRRALGLRAGRMAVAIRGYAPIPPVRAGAQVIVFDAARQPAYAWSFDRGDGLANVGYGELLDRRAPLTKAAMLARLEALLPGATAGATAWRGHHLPLVTGRWRPPNGPVLLAGDAAQLVNPMTGEGIYYAVATGLAAGRAAATALATSRPETAGARYAAATRALLSSHLRHIRLAARLCGHGAVLDAGLQASAVDRRVFDDLVELGLARGRLTGAVTRGLLGELLPGPFARSSRGRQGVPVCGS